MCSQTVLGFWISLKETFSIVITSTVINKYGKGAVIQNTTDSVSTHLPCFLSKGPVKQNFLDIDLATSLGAVTFGYTSSTRVIPFWKMFKN